MRIVFHTKLIQERGQFRHIRLNTTHKITTKKRKSIKKTEGKQFTAYTNEQSDPITDTILLIWAHFDMDMDIIYRYRINTHTSI